MNVRILTDLLHVGDHRANDVSGRRRDLIQERVSLADDLLNESK